MIQSHCFVLAQGQRESSGHKLTNTKSSVTCPTSPSLLSNEEAKHVGSDCACWPLFLSLYHLPFLEPLKALSLPVLQEQIRFVVDEV